MNPLGDGIRDISVRAGAVSFFQEKPAPSPVESNRDDEPENPSPVSPADRDSLQDRSAGSNRALNRPRTYHQFVAKRIRRYALAVEFSKLSSAF